MSERRGSDLARRMKERLEEEEASRARAIAERERQLAAARAARDELFHDLEAFADILEPVASARQGESLVLRRGDRFLQLEPMGDSDRVRVTFPGADGEDHRLYREAALGDRWVWSFTRGRRGEERLPLFDVGLEELLVLALDLPRVNEPPEDPVTSRPSTQPKPVAPPPDKDPFAAFSKPEPPDPDLPPAKSPVKRNL